MLPSRRRRLTSQLVPHTGGGGGGKDGSAKLMTKAGERGGERERAESLRRKGRRRERRKSTYRPANRPTADRTRIRCAILATYVLRLLVRFREIRPQHITTSKDGGTERETDAVRWKTRLLWSFRVANGNGNGGGDAKAAGAEREKEGGREEGSERGDAHSAGQVWVVHGTEGQWLRIILLRFEFCQNMSAPRYR